MNGFKYNITPGAVAELMTGGGEFLAPRKILEDLSEEQATIAPPGSPYTIAQIVAHMQFWQERQLALGRGEDPPRPESLDATFVAPPPGTWETLRADFLAGIAAVAALATEKPDALSRENEDTSLPYDLAESALHNGYHFGQIVLLRQILGLWPPAGGDDTEE